MPTTLTPEYLTTVIKQLPPDFVQACCDGHCDAFALALTQFMKQHGVAGELQVGTRYEVDEDDETIDENPFSHVVVEAFGTTWDANGPDACAQWESLWNTCEHMPPYHDFDWNTHTEKKLRRLRQKRDDRDIDPEYIAKTLQFLVADAPVQDLEMAL